MHNGWDSADLLDRFQLSLGRGTGGNMEADELWTDARAYRVLADAQEAVYTDLAPRVPGAFMSAPAQLTSSDGGVTYTFASYPFGHVEVYAQELGGRVLTASTYDDPTGDFVIQGQTIRTPGNRARTYASGPWARYVSMPVRISASEEPSVQPESARELILWKALDMATDVAMGAMDPTPWRERYADARMRWLITWQTQYATQTQPGRGRGPSWWLAMDAWNGVTG
jgi:hypothetical protein